MKNLSLTIALVVLLAGISVIGSAQDLVLYFNFEEGSGDSAMDGSGNGNNGTLMNGVARTTSPMGGAVQLDGEDDFIDAGNSDMFKIAKSVTLEAWVNSDDAGPTQFACGVPYDDGADWDNPWVGQQIGVRGSKMATWVSIAGEDREYDSGAIESGEWTHIAFTFDGDTSISYVNGEEVANNGDRDGETTYEGSPSFVVGVRSKEAPGEYFKGAIDEVALWSSVRSPEQIQADMGGIEPGGAVEPAAKSATTWGDLKRGR